MYVGLGNQDTSDPNSKVFVDPAALSQISEVEYDYSDLYDYEEDELEEELDGEAGKSRREIKEDEEMTSRMPEEYTSTEQPVIRRKPMVLISKVVETIVNKKKQAILKADKASYLQSLNGVEESKMSEREKISMNVIRSAGEDEHIDEDQPDATTEENVVSTTAGNDNERIGITVMNDRSDLSTRDEVTTEGSSPLSTRSMTASTAGLTKNETGILEPSAAPLKLKGNHTKASERTKKNVTEVDVARKERKERIKRELAELQGLFEATMAALSKEDIRDPSVHRVAWRLRTKRADKGMEASMSLANNTQSDKDACVVRNMTCVKFPSRRHCKGIALGR